MVWAAVSIGVGSAGELLARAKEILERYDDRVLVEARLDYLQDPFEALKLLSPLSSRLIITYRRPEEGGVATNYTVDRALHVFREASKIRPRFIDVELRTLKEARFRYRDLIASVHYVGDTPSEERMVEDVKVARDLSSIVKLVTYPRTFEEAVRPLSLYRRFRGLVAFSAGEEWKFTRFLALVLGSPLIYCSAKGKGVAPGQPTVDEALTLMEAVLW